MKILALPALVITLAGTSCVLPAPPDGRNTGGGGITAHEDHSARVPGASGTGASAANSGQGPVAGSGAVDVPNNAESASESNGGRGTQPIPAP